MLVQIFGTFTLLMLLNMVLCLQYKKIAPNAKEQTKMKFLPGLSAAVYLFTM